MSKQNCDEKVIQAKGMVDDIVQNHVSNIAEIPDKCVTLIKFLFSNLHLLHSDLNDYLETSGLLKTLISSLDQLPDLSRRDVLRLINLCLHTSRVLRDHARQSHEFQTFLAKSLDRMECWENRQKFKHHISIGSQLLADKEAAHCQFNTQSVRKLVQKAIDTMIRKSQQESDDMLPCATFYACSMFSDSFDDISYEKIATSESILNKEIIGKCLDVIRDYVQDFKVFYAKESEQKHTRIIFFKPKLELSFQQVCNTIVYYSLQNDKLRMNILQCGLYSQINNFLSIKFIPELLLSYVIDILKLPPMDDSVLKGVKNEQQGSIHDKLKVIVARQDLSEKTKNAIQILLKEYSISDDVLERSPANEIKPPRKTQESFLVPLATTVSNSASNSCGFGFENWGQLDVQSWLSDNNLGDLWGKLPNLTGRGLKQLQAVAGEHDKMKAIDFVMERLKIDFEMALELIGALEML